MEAHDFCTALHRTPHSYPVVCSLSPFGNIVASDTTMVPMYSMKKSRSSYMSALLCVSCFVFYSELVVSCSLCSSVSLYLCLFPLCSLLQTHALSFCLDSSSFSRHCLCLCSSLCHFLCPAGSTMNSLSLFLSLCYSV